MTTLSPVEPGDGAVLVSVVVPTHHRRELLARLLGSLERQTLDAGRFEVIIVHNYTDDGTEVYARAWCDARPGRASYHRKDFNGPTRSRDFGARNASGRFLAFIDDDCVATAHWLEAGVAAFARDAASRIGIVQGPTLPMPGQPRPFLSKTVNIDGPSIFYETCNIFYRREAFLEVGGFSEAFLDRWGGEDTDLGWKVTRAGYRAAYAPDALVHHEVFAVPLSKWLWEPRYYESLPLLVREHPALRAHLYRSYFVSKDTCLFNLVVLAGVALPLGWPLATALALPYVVHRFASGSHVGGWPARTLRLLAGIPRGLYMWWSLLKGSLHARTFLM